MNEITRPISTKNHDFKNICITDDSFIVRLGSKTKVGKVYLINVTVCVCLTKPECGVSEYRMTQVYTSCADGVSLTFNYDNQTPYIVTPSSSYHFNMQSYIPLASKSQVGAMPSLCCSATPAF